MRHAALWLASLATALIVTGSALADPRRNPPYYASIVKSRAYMRTGPARTYPATWLYQRADLPVRVVGVFKEWRKIADPDGTEGWMIATMIGATRTGLVRSDRPVPMLAAPTPGSRLLWRAAPGVVGRLSQCGNGWCRFDVHGQAGYVEADSLWGVDPTETLP